MHISADLFFSFWRKRESVLANGSRREKKSVTHCCGCKVGTVATLSTKYNANWRGGMQTVHLGQQRLIPFEPG